MKQGALMRFGLSALLVLICVACSGNVTVVDQFVTLKDGESHIFKLNQGTYRLELTSSGDSVDVDWIGSDCAGKHRVSSCSQTCTFEKTGQLVVKNPTVFATGPSATVTIKVVKLLQ